MYEQLSVGQIGTLRKVRLEHDNSGGGWHVDKVILKDKDTHERHELFVDKWLATEHEDGSLCREIAIPQEKGTTPAGKNLIYNSKFCLVKTLQF